MTKTQRLKAKAARLLPDYIPSEEERKWYMYCVRNDIIISPVGTPDPGKWYIGISDKSNHKKVYNSKFIYDKDTVMVAFYEMCKYYYDKNENKN